MIIEWWFFTLIWKVAKCPNCKREFSLDWLCKGKPGGCGGTREYVLTNCIVIPLLRPAYQPHNDKYWHRQWRGHQVTPVTAEDTKRRQALTSLWTLVIIISCFFSCERHSGLVYSADFHSSSSLCDCDIKFRFCISKYFYSYKLHGVKKCK